MDTKKFICVIVSIVAMAGVVITELLTHADSGLIAMTLFIEMGAGFVLAGCCGCCDW
jgi:hypothetical protein